MVHVISGGTSSRVRRSGSSRRKKIGEKGDSLLFPKRRSLSRCRNLAQRLCVIPERRVLNVRYKNHEGTDETRPHLRSRDRTALQLVYHRTANHTVPCFPVQSDQSRLERQPEMDTGNHYGSAVFWSHRRS